MIFGENGRRIGLLCINFYLNTPIAKLLPMPCEGLAAGGYLPEIFADNTHELLSQIVAEAKAEVEEDASILPSLKNKEIILRCNAKGVFQIKSAVNSVAQLLGISKNTVYLHLKAEKD